jgi:hypothetical protein
MVIARQLLKEGRTYRGVEEIRAWLATSAVEYTYTVELTGASASPCTTN